MSDKKLDQEIRERVAPIVGMLQLLAVLVFLVMLTVFILRTLGGMQISSVPRFDWQALATVAGCIYVLK